MVAYQDNRPGQDQSGPNQLVEEDRMVEETVDAGRKEGRPVGLAVDHAAVERLAEELLVLELGELDSEELDEYPIFNHQYTGLRVLLRQSKNMRVYDQKEGNGNLHMVLRSRRQYKYTSGIFHQFKRVSQHDEIRDEWHLLQGWQDHWEPLEDLV